MREHRDLFSKTSGFLDFVGFKRAIAVGKSDHVSQYLLTRPRAARRDRRYLLCPFAAPNTECWLQYYQQKIQ